MNHPSQPRRDFLKWSLAASAGALSVPALGAVRMKRAPEAGPEGGGAPVASGRKILILGGTGFLGPACVESALARGHTVTIFNRGMREQRRKDAGRPSVLPQDKNVEILYGNRDPEKAADDWKESPQQNPKGLARDPSSPRGLSSIDAEIKKGRTWDAVIDTSGYWPRIAKASAELLAPAVKQYVFISTLSVYAMQDKPITESTPLAVLEDPTTEEFGAQFQNYGPGKAACEAEIEKAMPGRVANIRPGFIVGPRDSSGRFMYWPLRAHRGGEMVVPGAPDDPIQIIDVRDLADWMIRCVEQQTFGVYNATGPDKVLTMRAMVEGCIKGCPASEGAAPTKAVWIDTQFCESNGVDPGEFPLYVPPGSAQAGMHQTVVSKAIAKGLTFRPVEDTAKATLAWYQTLPPEVQKGVANFDRVWEKEGGLLTAWKDAKGKASVPQKK